MTYKNRTVRFMGGKMKILFVDKCEDSDGNWMFGCKIGGSTPKLLISTKNENGEQLEPDEIELTLRHELFHAILDRLYFDISENETLVEWLATATRELHKQGICI